MPGLDLSGTAIAEDLRLGSALPEHTSPRWQGNAQLVLRNVHAGAVQDRENAWPPILDLQGFTYDRLGGVAGAGHDMLSRPAEWYVGWLARDAAFTRQPYQQLAAVFRAAGDPNRANAVLYAERNRELAESWQRQAYLDVLGLAVLHSTIGYGLGRRIFRVLYWIAGFTALGIAILRFSPSARAKGLWWCLGASLDRLLPIVELNKEFGDFFDDPERRRLKGWQAAYFSVQALVGYLLGTFVVAALSGLTQAS